MVRNFLVLIVSGGIFLVLALQAACSHPFDSMLEANFYQHEADFEKLIQMSNEDAKVVRIAPTFTRLDTNWAWPRPHSELGFSKKRWDEYRHFFKKLGLKAGLDRDGEAPDVIVFLPVSMTGMVTGGDEKGYAYSTKEPCPLLDSLDDTEHIHAKVESLQPAFKRLKGNWYIYYMWDD